MFTKFLFKDKEAYYQRLGEFEAPKGDNWNSGIGLATRPAARLTLNLALGATLWQDEEIARLVIVPQTVLVKAYVPIPCRSGRISIL